MMMFLLLRLPSAELSMMLRLLRLRTPDWLTLNWRDSVVTATKISVMKLSQLKVVLPRLLKLLLLPSEFKRGLALFFLSRRRLSKNNNNSNARRSSPNSNNKRRLSSLPNLLKRNLKNATRWSMPLLGKAILSAFLKSLLLSVEMVVKLETTGRRLFLLPVCLPIDPELLSFMKKRSDLEKSSLNLETWIRFSNLRCRLHLPVPTLDFKQWILIKIFYFLLKNYLELFCNIKIIFKYNIWNLNLCVF